MIAIKRNIQKRVSWLESTNNEPSILSGLKLDELIKLWHLNKKIHGSKLELSDDDKSWLDDVSETHQIDLHNFLYNGDDL